MRLIREGMKEELNVSKYAKPKYKLKKMKRIKGNLEIDKYFEKMEKEMEQRKNDWREIKKNT